MADCPATTTSPTSAAPSRNMARLIGSGSLGQDVTARLGTGTADHSFGMEPV